METVALGFFSPLSSLLFQRSIKYVSSLLQAEVPGWESGWLLEQAHNCNVGRNRARVASSLWIRVQNLFPAFHGSDFSAFDGLCKLCWSLLEAETEKLQEVLHCPHIIALHQPSPLLRWRKEMFSTYTFSMLTPL